MPLVLSASDYLALIEFINFVRGSEGQVDIALSGLISRSIMEE